MKYEPKESDIQAFASYLGIRGRQRGEELQLENCPYCHSGKSGHDKWSSSINLRTGQFKCLRDSCGMTGNMVTLSRDFNFSLGSEYEEYIRPRKQYRNLTTPKEPIKPKQPAVEYMKSRGISEEITAKYELTVQKEHENILVFPFYDEKGKMQFVKYRKTDFDKARDKNKEWCEAGCKPILFGMKQCEGFERLVVTEGQLDSLSIAEAGIKNAVSVPTGSKGFTWIPYCWDWMRRFKEIVVFGDFERGKMSLLEDIRKRFPNTIKAVREEDYRGCKDANEILQKYGREAVKEAVERAHILPVKRVKQLADVEKVDIYSLPKLKTGIVRLDRHLSGGMHFGQIVLIAGKRGDGKSTLAGQIMANAIGQNYKCLVYSGEMPDYLYKSWMDFQIAGPDFINENTNPDGTPNRFITNSRSELINAWYRDKCFIYDSSIIDDDEGEDLLKTIEKAVMQYGIKVVLIDNLMTAIDLDIDRRSDKYDRQSNFVKKLAKLSLTYDLIIMLVAHRRKNTGGSDANDEVSGSADITNLAGTVLSYDRDKDLPDTQRKLIVSKYRLTGKLCLDGYVLDYDEKSKRIYGEDDDLYKNYGWNTVYDDNETPFG